MEKEYKGKLQRSFVLTIGKAGPEVKVNGTLYKPPASGSVEVLCEAGNELEVVKFGDLPRNQLWSLFTPETRPARYVPVRKETPTAPPVAPAPIVNPVIEPLSDEGTQENDNRSGRRH